MQFAEDLAQAVGNTPLIKLRRVSEETGCTILGKAEFLNPGGSVKDRAALYIIRDAEKSGRLRPGGHLRLDQLEAFQDLVHSLRGYRAHLKGPQSGMPCSAAKPVSMPLTSPVPASLSRTTASLA